MFLQHIEYLLLVFFVPAIAVHIEELVTSVNTTAIHTSVARLPCDLTPDSPENRVILVIWYKDGATIPIYSVDARDRSLEEANHWADEHALGGRAFFRVASDPDQPFDTHLALENVRDVDAGSYRCRVDFQGAPTRNSVVNLTVIVPPRKLAILDEKGMNALPKRVVGPYIEGSIAHITCVASGGRPAPRVTWWSEGVEIDNSDEAYSERRVKNVLRLENLERRHLNSVFVCKASNNDVTPPLTGNISLNIYLRPLDVRMLGENQPLSASNEYEVACQTFGSRPPANISWWKSGLLLDRNRQTNARPVSVANMQQTSTHPNGDLYQPGPSSIHPQNARPVSAQTSTRPNGDLYQPGPSSIHPQTSADGNATTSILTFTPQVDDTGKSLTCRAENIHIRGSAQEDSWTLNVHYSPIVSLELGSNLNGSLIREGVDVYFDCIIQANPWVNKVTWKHNGQELQNNVSMGTILSNQTLILQSVSRKISGMYTCQGSNSEGDTESKAFHLDVKYEPECSVGQQRVYGAARHEQVTVLCQVDANPPANLFRWSFNNSAVQSVQVDSVISEPGGGRSIASYKPQSERDYGTLLCWGRNELGSQAVPCVFHVVPAGKPDSPRNCVVVNRTSTSVLVNCVKGFDGGLPQDFVMEVFSAADGQRRLISNISSSTKPEFVVAGLEPGTGYFVSVYAANGKGRSSSSTLSVSTLKSTHQEHRRTAVATTFPSFPQVSPILWILAGVLVTLSLVGLIALITFRIKGRLCSCIGQEDDDQHTSTGSAESDIDATRKVQSSTSGNLLTVDLQAVKGPNLVTSEEMDERNPDVIPHTAEIEYPVEKLNMESIGRSSSAEAQTPKAMNYSNIPQYSSSETVQVEGAPVRWQPPRTAAATMTQNAETQTQTHKESAV